MKVVSVTANSAILVWDGAANENVTHYVHNFPNQTLCTSRKRSTYCNISTTNACSVCCYYVMAYINELSLGPPTEVHVTTLPSPPCISTSITLTYRTVTVSWSGCPGAQRYYVSYRRSVSQTWSRTIIETPRTSVTISSLLQLNTYQFRVQCKDAIGRSSFSSTKSYTMQGIITTNVSTYVK